MDKEKIARTCLLMYIQHWGQSLDKRIDALNAAIKAAGIEAVFTQSSYIEAGWIGDKEHTFLAKEMRKDIDRIRRGEFHSEARQILAIIENYEEKVRKL